MYRLVGWFLCLCLMVGVLGSAAAAKSKRRSQRSCQSYKEYLNPKTGKCKSCSTCGPGRGVAVQCTEKNDTVCEKCVAGRTFSTGRSHRGSPCYPCSTCGGRQIVKQCTPSSDTVCGECPIGTYWDEIFSRCQTCSYCFGSSRQAGLYTVKACIKKEIPTTHWCIHRSSPPHSAPPLRSKVTPDGSVSFYTDPIAKILDIDTSQEGALEYEEFIVLDEESQPDNAQSNEINLDVFEEGWLDHTVENPFVRPAAPSADTMNLQNEPEGALLDAVTGKPAPPAEDEDKEEVLVKIKTPRSSYDLAVLIACTSVFALCTFVVVILAWKKCRELSQQKDLESYQPIYKPKRNCWTKRTDHGPINV